MIPTARSNSRSSVGADSIRASSIESKNEGSEIKKAIKLSNIEKGLKTINGKNSALGTSTS